MSRLEEMGIFEEDEIFEHESEDSPYRAHGFPVGSLLIITIGAALAFLGLRNLFLNFTLSNRIHHIMEECSSYRNVEKKLASLKRKRALVRSMIQKINTLKENKRNTIEFYESLTTMVPPGIIVSIVKKVNQKIIIKGYATDANGYSGFIQALNNSGFFREKIEETRNSRGEFFIAGIFIGREK